ncbi:DNA adenine methylase [Brucella intermedia]|uniref:DNA adenine methylase n=1 Tax=Brucella intermedia TaxID=94625 RepID=UPI0004691DA0|nr:DNA adenine methylase [Brucella intermedia]
MTITASPLRYPGGKSSLLPMVSELLRINGLSQQPYAEPYAGGCGLALDLLFGGHVSEIHINDVDPSIWSFWHSVLFQTVELVDMIEKTPVTVEEWQKQKEIQAAPSKADTLSLGFATFFLNRTNRSGIIKGAGMIGGIQQNGNYKIDCRYNKSNLIRRILRISKYKELIFLTNMDALDFMLNKDGAIPAETFFCIDPPYFNKGSSLYTSFYGPSDHAGVADLVMKLDHPWIVTYDNVQEVRDLYPDQKKYAFNINYSVQTKRVGNELLIASKHVTIPDSLATLNNGIAYAA